MRKILRASDLCRDTAKLLESFTPVTNREYVIVSLEHSENSDLAFWGSKTGDHESRSFSGYTFNVDECERYAAQDIISGSQVPFFNGDSLHELLKYKDVAITIDNLSSLVGLKTLKVIRIV